MYELCQPSILPPLLHDYSIALCFELKRVSSSFQRDFIELVSQLGCGLDDMALARSVSDAPHNLEVGRRRFLLVSGSIDKTTPFRSVNVQFRGNNIQQRWNCVASWKHELSRGLSSTGETLRGRIAASFAGLEPLWRTYRVILRDS